MKNVLFVDDSRSQHPLSEELSQSFLDLFIPNYALNGQDAVDILNKKDISLLVTNLAIPGDLEGRALIEHVENKHNNIPCVAIVGTKDIKEIKQLKNKVDHILFKPINGNELVQVVTTIINGVIASGSLNEIPAVSFLQLLEMGKKTCLVKISLSKSNFGLMYFKKGILYDAVYGDLHGEEAACGLISMNDTRLRLLNLPKKKIRRRINAELMSIILEIMQLKEEAALNDQKGENSSNCMLEEKGNKVVPGLSEPTAQHLALRNRNTKETQKVQKGAFASRSKQKEIIIMALETNLEAFRSIKGYKAAALMNFTGEVLAADTVDDNVDLANVGAVFNDIFRSSHEAAGKVGLDVCSELTIKTPNGLIIMACSGVDAPVHFHLITVLDQDGNQALAKMQLDKAIPQIMKELS